MYRSVWLGTGFWFLSKSYPVNWVYLRGFRFVSLLRSIWGDQRSKSDLFIPSMFCLQSRSSLSACYNSHVHFVDVHTLPAKLLVIVNSDNWTLSMVRNYIPFHYKYTCNSFADVRNSDSRNLNIEDYKSCPRFFLKVETLGFELCGLRNLVYELYDL